MRPAQLVSLPAIWLFLAGPAIAEENRQELLDRALRAFEQGKQAGEDRTLAGAHFARAAEAFEALRRAGAHNASLYLNQGNAELLAGRPAHALLAYHRGLRLSPNDATLRSNRDFVRARVQYASAAGHPLPSSWPPWLPVPTLGLSLSAAAVLYVLACLALTRWLMVGRRRWAVRATLCFLFAAVTGAGACWARQREVYETTEPLVVVTTDATLLHRGNGQSYPRHETVPALPAGLEARRIAQRGDWLQIRLSTGEIGWVRNSDVLIDDANE